MTYAVDLIFPGGAYSLSDGSPFRIESAEDLSPSEVIRLEQRGPTQDGAVDLGFRLAPRTFTLNLLFYAATATLLDSYRATLFTYFMPSRTLTLRYTRDDGAYRYLTCVAVGEMDIRLVPEERPGHLHRATVTLRAADPRWYGAVKTPGYTGGSAQIWYTGGGVIGTANVMEHVEYPSQGLQWSAFGNLTSSWTVAFRSPKEPAVGTPTAFYAGTGAVNASNTKDGRFYYDPTAIAFSFDHAFPWLAAGMPDGTLNYMYVHDASASDSNDMYTSGTSLAGATQLHDFDLVGFRNWRAGNGGSASTFWTNELPKTAIYNKALSSAERVALNAWMGGTAILGTVVAVNAGDLDEYPLVTISGPLVDPVLTNAATGDIIDLTGFTLGTADSLTIDLRTGNKQLTNVAGSSVIGTMGTALQLADFYLAPAPIAAGGTNNIVVQGGSVSTSTMITVTHYDRYMSF
jgi:hypothetical protein